MLHLGNFLHHTTSNKYILSKVEHTNLVKETIRVVKIDETLSDIEKLQALLNGLKDYASSMESTILIDT